MVGIYKITNLINNKIYIGKSADDVEKRCYKDHIRDLNNGTHCNKHLQRAWEDYGQDNFVFEIIEFLGYECFNEELFNYINSREQYWIKIYKSNDPLYGYNMTEGGEGMFGFKHTEETKKRMSESTKNTYKDNSMRQKASEATSGIKNGMFGKKHTEETKNKLSKIHSTRIRKPLTEETKIKIGLSNKGKNIGKSPANKNVPTSEEIKQKISKANKGKQSWMKGKHHNEKSKQLMSESHKGQKLSEEHKRKIAMSITGKASPMKGKEHSLETKEKIRNKMINNQVDNLAFLIKEEYNVITTEVINNIIDNQINIKKLKAWSKVQIEHQNFLLNLLLIRIETL